MLLQVFLGCGFICEFEKIGEEIDSSGESIDGERKANETQHHNQHTQYLRFVSLYPLAQATPLLYFLLDHNIMQPSQISVFQLISKAQSAEAKTLQDTLTEEKQVVISLSAHIAKSKQLKDQIKDNDAFQIVVLALSKVGRLQLTVKESKYMRKNLQFRNNEIQTSLLTPHKKLLQHFSTREREERSGAFSKLEQISVAYEVNNLVKKQENYVILNFIESLLDFLSKIRLANLKKLKIAVFGQIQNFEEEVQQKISRIEGLTIQIAANQLNSEVKELCFCPTFCSVYCAAEREKEELSLSKITSLKLMQCSKKFNERIKVLEFEHFLSLFSNLKQLIIEMEPSVMFQNLEALSSYLGSVTPLLQILQIYDNDKSMDNQKALKNLLFTCGYLCSVNIKIEHVREQEWVLLRLILGRRISIQKMINTLKILEKKGYNKSTCLEVINCIKPLII